MGLLGGSAFLQSCEDGSAEDTYEASYSQSVQTYIQEVEPNKFQIVHEEVGAEGTPSQAHINFLNGTSKSLTLEEAQQMLAAQAPDTTMSVPLNQIDTVSKPTTAQNSTSSIPHNNYNDNANGNTSQNYSNGGSYQTYHSGGSSLSTIIYYSALGNMLGRHHQQYAPAHFYHSSDSYNRSFSTNSTLRNSVSSAPKSSRTGFFGGSSRSRSYGS